MYHLTKSLLVVSTIMAAGIADFDVHPELAHATASSLSTTQPTVELTESAEFPFSIASRLRYRFYVSSSSFRRGGFSRGGTCPSSDSLMAIAPQEDASGDTLEGAAAYLTAADHPTFFFYVTALPATTGKFTLQRPDLPLTERTVYETDFAFEGQSGIMGIQIPSDAPPLEAGVNYVWQVSIACSPDTIEDSLSLVGGVVEKVPDITGTATERLDFYLEQGIWQDAVSVMAEDIYTNPSESEFAAEFSSLLQAVGLEAIADAPIVQISKE